MPNRRRDAGLLLRLFLAIIDLVRWVAPVERRREWRRQWRADIWHEWQWLSGHRRGIGDRVALATRVTGAVRHAFWLRMHVRRLEMITHDLRYGWRQMLRRPGLSAAAVMAPGPRIGAHATEYQS